MDKIAKNDPMKRGYIVGQAIKGGLKGAAIGGGIGAGYSGVKMLKNLPDTPTKQNLIGLGVRTGLGIGIGAYGGASMAKSKAIDARIEANIPKEEKEELNALAQQEERARKHLNKLTDSVYQNLEDIGDGYSVSIATPKQKQEIRDAERARDSAATQHYRAHQKALSKSKKDLLQRGLLKKAEEQRLGAVHTLKRTGQGALIGGAIGGIGLGAGSTSLKGLAAGAALGSGLGGLLGYNQGQGERKESFADPELKRKYEKALDAYRSAHKDYENRIYHHLGTGVDCDGTTLVLTKKERNQLDKIRAVVNQKQSELDAARKDYKESAKHNFKNRHNKTASVSSFDEFTKEAAGYEEGLKTLGVKLDLSGKARVLNNLVDSSRASISQSQALQRAALTSAKQGYKAANKFNPSEFWRHTFNLHAKTEKAKDILDRHDKRHAALAKYIRTLKEQTS